MVTMPAMRNENGVTLLEVLIASALLTTVFVAAGTIYLTATRYYNYARDNVSRVGVYYAMEYMARRLALASQLSVTDAAGNPLAAGTAGPQVRMAWDYDTSGNPNAGDSNPANDTWTTFGFVEEGAVDRLRFRGPIDPPAQTVNNTHTEVYPGLAIVNTAGSSSFTLSNAPATPNTLTIRLVATVGNPPRTLVLTRSVTPHAMAN